MTVFASLSALMYNDENWSLGTIKVSRLLPVLPFPETPVNGLIPAYS